MKYLFDLDGTLTRCETLPLIAQTFGLEAQIGELTQQTIQGNIPFVESFIHRVNILKELPVSQVCALLATVALHESVLQFIRDNQDDCVIVTGNCRVWVQALAQRIGCELIASETSLVDDRIVKLTKIVKKEDVVRAYQAQGEQVVFIGDGNNDAEAMRLADVSLASGLIHMPSRSVLDVCDYLVFDENTLARQLNQIRQSVPGYSIVLSCAGVGSRMGLGVTKTLLKLNDRLIIDSHLDNFKAVEDVRIVVGFQAMRLIEHVVQQRRDVVFVFNHDYFNTKTGHSYYLGARHGREHAIEWDGDLLVNPRHMPEMLVAHEYAAGSIVASEEPIYMTVQAGEVQFFHLDDQKGAYEWTGPCSLRKDKLSPDSQHVYDSLRHSLPLPFKLVEAYDIDTYEDYLRVSAIVKDWH
jgi:HAD superfamily phosphoserine phosphatase-like hydrolase